MRISFDPDNTLRGRCQVPVLQRKTISEWWLAQDHIVGKYSSWDLKLCECNAQGYPLFPVVGHTGPSPLFPFSYSSFSTLLWVCFPSSCLLQFFNLSSLLSYTGFVCFPVSRHLVNSCWLHSWVISSLNNVNSYPHSDGHLIPSTFPVKKDKCYFSHLKYKEIKYRKWKNKQRSGEREEVSSVGKKWKCYGTDHIQTSENPKKKLVCFI